MPLMAKKVGQLAPLTFEEVDPPGPVVAAEKLPNRRQEFLPGLNIRGVCFEVCRRREVMIRSPRYFHFH
jgi:hypothetical protein